MHGQVGRNLFGEPVASGNRNISELIRIAMDEGHNAEVARAMAFWRHEATESLLLQLSEVSDDEHDAAIAMWARNNHGIFETIARAKRRQIQDDVYRLLSAGGPKKYHKSWLTAYYGTSHWAMIREMASAYCRRDPDLCILCAEPRDDWHHPTYEYIGTDQDAEVIIPLCASHHSMVHAMDRKIEPGTMPDSVRQIINEEQSSWQ